jgi:hypothetical protein
VSSTEEMKVEMLHRLPPINTRIHDDTIPMAKSLLAGNLRRDPMQMAQHGPVDFAGILHGSDMGAGNDQHVRGGLRMKVRKCIANLVLIEGGRWDGAFNDLTEDAAHGENSVQRALAGVVEQDLPALRAFAPNERKDAVIFFGFTLGGAF